MVRPSTDATTNTRIIVYPIRVFVSYSWTAGSPTSLLNFISAFRNISHRIHSVGSVRGILPQAPLTGNVRSLTFAARSTRWRTHSLT